LPPHPDPLPGGEREGPAAKPREGEGATRATLMALAYDFFATSAQPPSASGRHASSTGTVRMSL
jgi:hypothetical protein